MNLEFTNDDGVESSLIMHKCSSFYDAENLYLIKYKAESDLKSEKLNVFKYSFNTNKLNKIVINTKNLKGKDLKVIRFKNEYFYFERENYQLFKLTLQKNELIFEEKKLNIKKSGFVIYDIIAIKNNSLFIIGQYFNEGPVWIENNDGLVQCIDIEDEKIRLILMNNQHLKCFTLSDSDILILVDICVWEEHLVQNHRRTFGAKRVTYIIIVHFESNGLTEFNLLNKYCPQNSTTPSRFAKRTCNIIETLDNNITFIGDYRALIHEDQYYTIDHYKGQQLSLDIFIHLPKTSAKYFQLKKKYAKPCQYLCHGYVKKEVKKLNCIFIPQYLTRIIAKYFNKYG